MNDFQLLVAKDLWVTPLVFVIILAITHFTILSKSNESRIRLLLLAGLLLRLFGAVISALVYNYYYGFGDTFGYFRCATCIHDAWDESISLGLEVLREAPSNYSPEASILTGETYFKSLENRMICKIAGVLSILTGGSYLGMSFSVSFLGFLGSFKIFQILRAEFPKYEITAIVSCFFIPSIFFWGAGVTKDPIALCAFGFLIHSVWWLLNFGRNNIRGTITNLILSACSSLILLSGKYYIFACAFLAAMLVLILAKNKSRFGFLQNLIIVSIVTFLLYQLAPFIQEMLGITSWKYASINQKLRIIQEAQLHSTQADGGSGYDIGMITPGLVSENFLYWIRSLNVTLFRPYVWEFQKIINLPTILESLALLLASIYVLLKWNLRLIVMLRNNVVLLFCCCFTIILAMFVGAVSYNFGTLARFRLPLMPLFGFLLLYLSLHPRKVSNASD